MGDSDKSKEQLLKELAELRQQIAELEELAAECKREKAARHKTTRALKVLSECNKVLVRTTDESTLLHEICRIIVETGEYRLAWVGFAEQDEAKTVRPVAQVGYEEKYLDTVQITWADSDRGRGPTGTAIRTGEPAICRNMLTDPQYAPWRAEALKRGYASSIALPLLANGQTFGALNIYAVEPDAFDEEEVELLVGLGNDLVYGILTLRTRAERKRVAEALRESEEKYRNLVERANDGITIIQEGLVKFANLRLAVLWGGTVEEIVNTPFTNYVHPDELSTISERYERRMAGEEVPSIYETTLVRKDGSKVFAELNAGTITYQGKRADLVIVRDITERKKAEEELKESEKKYRELINGMNDTVWVIDFEGHFIDVNDAAVKVLGYSREELLSMGPQDIDTSLDREAIRDLIRRMPTDEIQVFETTHTTKDRRTIPVEILSSLVAYQGKQAILSIARDITERKRAEEALRKSETILNETGLIARIGGWEHDLVTGRATWTRALYDIDDLESGPPPGPNEHLDQYPPRARARLSEAYQHAVETGEPFDLELQVYTAKKRLIWGRVIGRPIMRDGKCVRMVGTFQDITERKQVEEERERLIKDLEVRHAEMERFVYAISHDLRTPLVTLQGYTDLLRRDIERNEQRQVETDLTLIENAVLSMGQLLADTLELSRTGRVMNPPEDVPFRVLVRDALAYLVDQIKLSAVDISVAEDFPTVHVDRIRIVEVLVNLIENSIKFMGDQPHPKIEIGYRVKDGETVFFLKDNGIGLDKDQFEKVFELFYKVDKSSKGSGAGLAIVKRIIEVHGGRIWVESELGRGYTVLFTLPVVT